MQTMKIYIEHCYGGGFYWRLNCPGGMQERIADHDGRGQWTRAMACAALDILENLYGLNRKSVRFEIR